MVCISGVLLADASDDSPHKLFSYSLCTKLFSSKVFCTWVWGFLEERRELEMVCISDVSSADVSANSPPK